APCYSVQSRRMCLATVKFTLLQPMILRTVGSLIRSMRPLIMGCAKPALPVVLRVMITAMRSAQMVARVEGDFTEDSCGH
ncbi:hypothetical protein KI387_039900, partial [Taxus chinensis]